MQIIMENATESVGYMIRWTCVWGLAQQYQPNNKWEKKF